MKKEIKSEYQIRLDFKKETENPSRLFKGFAEMIDGIYDLDFLIAQTVNSEIKSKIVLDDIEKGSLIGKLYNNIVIGSNKQLAEIENEIESDKIEEYLEESRAETLKFISEGKSSVKDLENLKESITKIANDKGVKDTFNFGEPEVIKLAETINEINKSTDSLKGEESFEIKSKNQEVKNIRFGTQKIDIESVENALTKDEIINKYKMIYLIKKPDFLGETAWSFKHGKKSVSAKISDIDWLKEFQSGKIIVVPGDSLKVTVKQTAKYNASGHLISDKLEIIEIIDILKKNEN